MEGGNTLHIEAIFQSKHKLNFVVIVKKGIHFDQKGECLCWIAEQSGLNFSSVISYEMQG